MILYDRIPMPVPPHINEVPQQQPNNNPANMDYIEGIRERQEIINTYFGNV